MIPSPPAILIALLGILLAGFGILAHTLGLDPNESWGMGRLLITIGGVLVIVLGLLYDRLKPRVELFPSKAAKKSGATESQKVRDIQLWVASCVVILLTGLFYTWVTTAGTWTRWDSYTYYYDDLAAGFLEGHVHLATEPSQELLALADPYDPDARSNVTYFIDASFYKGRYYLYWGPVPALLLVLPKLLSGGVIGDLFPLYFFALGTLGFKCALLALLFRRFFAEQPLWLFGTGLLVAALVGHHAWTLNSPRIYEAATTGGGFFFIAGFYFAYRAIESNFHLRELTLAGIMWALALGTRMTQALPVASTILLMAFHFHAVRERGSWKPALALGIPLALAFVGLAGYNLVRFGSVTEFGLYYMLIAGMDLQSLYDLMFSIRYIPQNIYNYLFAPFTLKPRFPFFATERGFKEALLPFYSVPVEYFTERITGLFRSSPILTMSLLPPSFLALQKPWNLRSDWDPAQRSLFRWLILSLTAATVMGFLPVAAYFWAGNRFLADFLSPLSVLAVVGLWLGYSLPAGNSRLKPMLVVAILLTAGFSILVNLFLLNEVDRIATLNPDLFRQLTAFRLFPK